jgi:hypothetical protein
LQSRYDSIPEKEREKMKAMNEMDEEAKKNLKPEDMPDMQVIQSKFQEMIPIVVDAAWAYSKYDVINTVKGAVKRVLLDRSIDTAKRRARAQGCVVLAKAFERECAAFIPDPSVDHNKETTLAVEKALYQMMAAAQGFSEEERSEFVPGSVFHQPDPGMFDPNGAAGAPESQSKPESVPPHAAAKPVEQMSVSELKAEIDKRGLNRAGCVEKSDLVNLLTGRAESEQSSVTDEKAPLLDVS